MNRRDFFKVGIVLGSGILIPGIRSDRLIPYRLCLWNQDDLLIQDVDSVQPEYGNYSFHTDFNIKKEGTYDGYALMRLDESLVSVGLLPSGPIIVDQGFTVRINYAISWDKDAKRAEWLAYAARCPKSRRCHPKLCNGLTLEVNDWDLLGLSEPI